MLCCVVLRCVALCCVALRCVVLCCVVLCCVVLCCVVLCCVVLSVCACRIVMCRSLLCCVWLCCFGLVMSLSTSYLTELSTGTCHDLRDDTPYMVLPVLVLHVICRQWNEPITVHVIRELCKELLVLKIIRKCQQIHYNCQQYCQQFCLSLVMITDQIGLHLVLLLLIFIVVSYCQFILNGYIFTKNV